jgi:hypothetical protein
MLGSGGIVWVFVILVGGVAALLAVMFCIGLQMPGRPPEVEVKTDENKLSGGREK